jgi:hypothetical protein
MNSKLTRTIGGFILSLSLLLIAGTMSRVTVQAQYRDQDRDDRYFDYNRVARIAQNRGYEEGFSAGANDARDGLSFSPQRSRALRDVMYNTYESSSERAQVFRRNYREGFMRGYQEGFERNNRNVRRPRWWPW